MPLYEYQCPDCEKPFEELIRNAQDERSVACPACGQSNVVRLLSAPAVGGGDAGESPSPGSCAPRGGFT